MLRQQFGAVRIRQLSCTPRRSHRSSNMVDVEYRRSLRTGAGKSLKWISDVMRFRMPCLRTCSVRKVFPEPSDMYQSIEHMRAMQTSPTYDRLLGLWSLSGTVMQRIQLLNLKPAMTADSICDDETVGATCKPGIDVNPFGAVIMKSLSKVTHLCWAPMSSAEDSSSCVLYTTMCILGNHPSLALFRKLDSNSVEQLVSTEFNLGKNAAWTCAWNKFSQKFSIGSERKAFLVDLKTRRLWELKTGKGDVLSQTFTHQTGSSLYSGTRRGLICQHDLRSSSTHYVSSFSHKSSVCHLHLLRDENYLLASDFSGKINMWDIRKAKVVMEYPGHKNDYSRIPFGVDETETIIYSAGQDCFTRIWSLQDGSLLHTIPPPYPASREIIPVLSYSGRWTGRNIPGLLMGIKDEIRFYSL
ncbi:DDB1- and CUL4-associated factor 4-like protein 2 [Lineus longissimus]|uniref:DDB1- and CUL4-associated factor 4-like protein 2 n=1 Tax=Lineus longissimus TaxID=88925 RepID=UPI00315D5D44